MPLLMTEDNKYKPGLCSKQGCMITAVIGGGGELEYVLKQGHEIILLSLICNMI